jgi:hypothetical protein
MQVSWSHLFMLLVNIFAINVIVFIIVIYHFASFLQKILFLSNASMKWTGNDSEILNLG